MKPASVGHTPKESRVSRRFTIITVMFLSVLLGLLAYTIVTLQRDKSTAFLIDLAGRQRMLLQKHINEVFLTSQGVPADHVSTRKLMNSTLTALMKGGELVLDPQTDQRQTISPPPLKKLSKNFGNSTNTLNTYFNLRINSFHYLLTVSSIGRNFKPCVFNIPWQSGRLTKL